MAPIASCVGLAVAGLYLLACATRRGLRLAGAACVAIPVGMWLVALGERAAWWPESTGGPALIWLRMAVATSLAGAVTTIVSPTPRGSLAGFSLLLIGQAGLFLAFDADALAAASLLCGLAGGGWSFRRRSHSASLSAADSTTSTVPASPALSFREPLLACVTGGLLAVGLVAAIQQTLFAAAHRDGAALARIALRNRERAIAAQRLADQIDDVATSNATSLFHTHWMTLGLLSSLALFALLGAWQIVRANPADPRSAPDADGS